MSEEKIGLVLVCRLTDEEIQIQGERLGLLITEKVALRLKLEASMRQGGQLLAQIAKRETEISGLQAMIDVGHVIRQVGCVRRTDPTDGTIRTYRLDTGEELVRERQPAEAPIGTATAETKPAEPSKEKPPAPGFHRVSLERQELLRHSEAVMGSIFHGHHWQLLDRHLWARTWSGQQFDRLIERAQRLGLTPSVGEVPFSSVIAEADPFDLREGLDDERMVQVCIPFLQYEEQSFELLVALLPGIPWRVEMDGFVTDIRRDDFMVLQRNLEQCKLRLKGGTDGV